MVGASNYLQSDFERGEMTKEEIWWALFPLWLMAVAVGVAEMWGPVTDVLRQVFRRG